MVFEYKASVIVPVYNSEKYLEKCLDSLAGQTIDKADMEVLVIDDGSTDGSGDICLKYREKYDFIKLFSKDNEGLSATRNFGILNAKGKYLFFLDSDDYFTPETVKKVTSFFDKVYDEVDMVAYNEVRYAGKQKLKPHFRFDILKREGVYDLNEYPYISQTRVNVCVKNMDDYNILFNTTSGFRLEDQEYCNRVLMPKMKLGYCPDGTYMYNNGNESSLMSVYSYAYYLFQTNMEYYEGLFDTFADGEVPEYFQAVFVSDLQMRMKADILLPYQYEGRAFDMSVDRIRSLLKRVDDSVILNHPECDEINKYYFINMKYENGLSFRYDGSLKLKNGEETVYESDDIRLTVDRFRFSGNVLEICGHLSSPVFMYAEKPELFIRKKHGIESVELFESSFCCENAAVRNNQAWSFRTQLDTSSDMTIGFFVSIGEINCGVSIASGSFVPMRADIGRGTVVIGTKKCTVTEKRIVVSNTDAKAELKYQLKASLSSVKTGIKLFFARLAVIAFSLLTSKKKTYLYFDSCVSASENAYLQFVHDCGKNDGIKRYYVVSGSFEEKKALLDSEYNKKYIPFRSVRHKLLYFTADRILASAVENTAYIPFSDEAYKYYSDLFRGETVYIQNGVFNKRQPWVYSYDRLDVSRQVVSSDFERRTLTEEYGFPESALIKTKIPRFDLLKRSASASGGRMIFAPSWREYLIVKHDDGSFAPSREKLEGSDYFRELEAFLSGDELESLLEEYDLTLDVKLHPMLADCSDSFHIRNPRIRFVNEADLNSYSLMITDFSSIAFDFVYLNRPIIYFVPDYDKFKAGMHSFRKLIMPLEDGFGELARTSEEAVDAVGRIIENDGKILPPYAEKYSDFFYEHSRSCMDEIYDAITD